MLGHIPPIPLNIHMGPDLFGKNFIGTHKQKYKEDYILSRDASNIHNRGNPLSLTYASSPIYIS